MSTYTPPHAREYTAGAWNDPWRKLRHTLAWQYGSDRASAILDGADVATNLDQAAWRALGRPYRQVEP